jgi:hypothetical protein
MALNLFFTSGMIAGPVTLLATTGLLTRQWNDGLEAYVSLDNRLQDKSALFMEVDVELERDALNVLDAIPMANKLLDQYVPRFVKRGRGS